MAPTRNRYNSGLPNFLLAGTVAENVRALRKALGSAVRELSREDLAAMVADQHPKGRQVNQSTVKRWELAGVEPDLWSTAIMARMAGVTMEQFAATILGSGTIHDQTREQPNARVSSGGRYVGEEELDEAADEPPGKGRRPA